MEIIVTTVCRTSPLDDLKAKYPSDRLLCSGTASARPGQVTDAFAQAEAALSSLDGSGCIAAWGTFSG